MSGSYPKKLLFYGINHQVKHGHKLARILYIVSQLAVDIGASRPMIEDFLNSWSLFQDSYLVGWLVLVLLAIVGVIVVARDQIFIGAAVSQASTLGIALAMWISSQPMFHDVEWMHSEVEWLHSSLLLAASPETYRRVGSSERREGP